jgi:hypothetical protein
MLAGAGTPGSAAGTHSKYKALSPWTARLASRILLALALLVLQQGVLTHALSHAPEEGKPHGTKQCDLCQALSAADTEITPRTSVAVPSPAAASSPASPAQRGCDARRVLAFASRAPPALS